MMKQKKQAMIDVAVGVVLRNDGAVLFAKRPLGKAYEDYWEFPGGKLEAGESTEQALIRELMEEIGIQAQAIEQWRIVEYDYPHAFVRLHFAIVYRWQGEAISKEQQTLSWQYLPTNITPILPATLPLLAELEAYLKKDWQNNHFKASD